MTAGLVSGGDQDIDIGRLVILHVARMPYQRTDLQAETMRAFDLVRRWHAEGTDDHPCLRMLVYNLEPRFGLCVGAQLLLDIGLDDFFLLLF